MPNISIPIRPDIPPDLICSFCGQVTDKRICGPKVTICFECVDKAVPIVARKREIAQVETLGAVEPVIVSAHAFVAKEPELEKVVYGLCAVCGIREDKHPTPGSFHQYKATFTHDMSKRVTTDHPCDICGKSLEENRR